MIHTTVTGAAELRYVARLAERARVVSLKRELSEAHRQAFAPLLPAIRKTAAGLPSGYAPTMVKAIRVSARRSGLITYAEVHARGRAKDRDVRRIDAGALRHPVYGNRDVWRTTGVVPGFVSRPVGELGEKIATESLDALERITHEIAEG